MIKRLSGQDVFGFLRPEQVNRISDAAERIECGAGEMVYRQGARADHFFIVLDGEVSLRLPGRGDVSIVIDQLTKGDMFGSCACFDRETYALTAQCTRESVLLKVESGALKSLMDEDARMGYAMQSRLSAIYFNRYVETMQKLQAIVMNIPIEPERGGTYSVGQPVSAGTG